MFGKIKKISTKLGLAFGFVLVILLAAGFFSAFEYFNSTDAYKKYVHARINELYSIFELSNNLANQNKAWKDILLRGSNPADLKQYKNEFDTFDIEINNGFEELSTGDHRLVNNANIKDLNELKNAYIQMQNSYREALNIFTKNFDVKPADEIIKGIDIPISILTTKLIDGSIAYTEMKSEQMAALVKQKAILITIILIIASILGIIFAILFARNITKPIVSLNRAADLIAQGNLSVVVNSSGSDEIANLGTTFNLMVKNLKEILHKTIIAVGQITAAASQILSSSHQQTVGAREQSSAINETTSAATELSKNAEQIGENIKQVSLVASHVLAGMVKIKEAIGKTGTRVTSLNEKSQQIGKITELINDVADQTNLLAVNAAIEAARAGEEGRGFAVVADEIRKLADSTAKSTKDITALIEIIQHEMSNAIISMEQSVNNVNEESKLAEESADSAKEIAMSATQQIAGSKQIADAMSNINDSMKQIASGASEAQVSAKQLVELAQELKNITTKFKLT